MPGAKKDGQKSTSEQQKPDLKEKLKENKGSSGKGPGIGDK
jgi:hypothetical protein